ncbi:MAG: DNA recombination protein RmuC [Parasphingorhabdus sp.]|uniref:DNA recombination protein RmuC n=1 Tax=Parasphingorhabdus sp. TaxID=2709688 RepID=UPI0032993AFA
MDPVIAMFAFALALLIGGAIGWLVSVKTQGAQLDVAKEMTGSLRLQLDEVQKERDIAKSAREALATELAANKAAQQERDKAQDEKIVELQKAREQLSAQFAEVGNKLLEEAQDKFLKRADAKFDEAGSKSEERLKLLLSPMDKALQDYRSQVSKVEKERSEAYGDLKGLMDQMRVGQSQVRDETHRLVNSLRNAPKARGRWGEQQLKNVLETCGLAEHTDFVTELSVNTDEGRLRPDAIINVPGGKKLIIDAKVSLNDYQDAFEADDEDTRETAMARHCLSMKNHIEGLSRKAYWDQFEDAPDYVIMFVPGEHFLTAALEHEPTLWDHAFDKKVLLATPTNLVAIARTVAGVWRQEKMAAEAKQIGQLGKEMYDRLATAGEHLKRVGSGLGSAVGNYNKFVGSFERNVMATGRKFAELQIETGKKDLEEVPEIEALPRYSDDMTEDLIEDDTAFQERIED